MVFFALHPCTSPFVHPEISSLRRPPNTKSGEAPRPSFRRVSGLSLPAMADGRDSIYHFFISVWYVLSPVLSTQVAVAQHPFVKDMSAFLIVVYTARGRGPAHSSGVPTIFDNIVQGATTYFLVIFTGHLLVIFFELLAPVSNLSTDEFCSTHRELHVGTDPTPPGKVSDRLIGAVSGIGLTKICLIYSGNAV